MSIALALEKFLPHAGGNTHMSAPTTTAYVPMVRFQMFITAELRRQLEELSAESGAPLGEITRRALAAWVQRQQQNARPS